MIVAIPNFEDEVIVYMATNTVNVLLHLVNYSSDINQ